MLTIIHVSHEPIPLLELCLAHFRRVYPSVQDFPLIVIGDGVVGDYPTVAAKYGGTWVAGEQLKRTYKQPLWSIRFMRVALDWWETYTAGLSDAERAERIAANGGGWTLLLDPDTKLWRPFTEHTNVDIELNGVKGRVGCAGHIVLTAKLVPTISGSAARYTRECLEKCLALFTVGDDVGGARVMDAIWESMPVEYKQHHYAMQRYYHDQWMPYILKRAGMSIAETREVYSLIWDDIPRGFNIEKMFAATHPHKTLESWAQ